jgi:short-subunit dehydrogenase
MARVFIITGASRGIGIEIARELAKDNVTLVLSARDRAGLERTAELARRAGSRAVVVAGDMSREEDREALVRASEAEGEVEVLVNNAGVEFPFELTEQTPEEIERTLVVDLHAPILLTRRLLPGMIARRRGTLVFIASLSGKTATPYDSVYAAAKHGLVGFTSSLRYELEGAGVHAGVVCPGFVAEAGMWADAGLKAPALMPAVPIAKVVKGVRRVLNGEAEVLVTAGPFRPLLALWQLFPSLAPPLTRAIGATEALKRRSVVMLRRRRSGGNV